MKRNLITDRVVIDTIKRGQKSIHLFPNSIITDAARDRAKQFGIEFIMSKEGASSTPPIPDPRSDAEGKKGIIAIGSDHGGFTLKEALKPFLESLGYSVMDLGAFSSEACDYPDFAFAVARMVSVGEASLGIIVDAIGNASAIVANKLHGIRAACCTDEFSARSSREHNDVNVLTLGGRVLGTEIAKAITKAWLETPFAGGRHQKRIEKIGEIENRQLPYR